MAKLGAALCAKDPICAGTRGAATVCPLATPGLVNNGHGTPFPPGFQRILGLINGIYYRFPLVFREFRG